MIRSIISKLLLFNFGCAILWLLSIRDTKERNVLDGWTWQPYKPNIIALRFLYWHINVFLCSCGKTKMLWEFQNLYLNISLSAFYFGMKDLKLVLIPFRNQSVKTNIIALVYNMYNNELLTLLQEWSSVFVSVLFALYTNAEVHKK